MERYSRAFSEIRRISCDFINTPNFTKIFIWGVALHLIALFALLRGDIYYADDYINSANNGFWNHSRYLATFVLSTLSTLGKGTLDISPLPQILGVIFIVLSAMILLYLIRRKFDLLGILASLPLGLSPHFLQNLSYKFDALTMSLALFFAVLPFLFKENKRVFCVVSVICLILMFMTYQAANASYIILSLYFALFATSQNLKSRLKFLLLCALNLILASLIYGLFIDSANLGIGDAYATHEIARDFFTRVVSNLATYFMTIFSDLKQTPYIWLIALNCVLFVLNYKYRRIYAILFLALGFFASYGLYLVLERAIFEARVFYGFNALIALICIANSACGDFLGIASARFLDGLNVLSLSLASQNPKNSSTILEFASCKNAESSIKYIQNPPPHSVYGSSQKFHKILRFLSRASAIITAYFLISFANAYGNALKKQVEFLDFSSEMLLRDLGAVPKNANALVSVETLTSKKHPVARRFAEKYGNIARILPNHYLQSHLSDGWNYDSGGVCAGLRGNVVVSNAWHRIEKVGACYVVTIK